MSSFAVSRRSTLLAASALAALASGQAAMAEELTVEQRQSATTVADVVVTASGFEQRITQAPASISVVPRQEIEEMRAASIAEILTLNDEIRELIVDKQPIRRIKAAAHANGTRSLRLAALDLVKRGATTIDEIKRVTLHA